VRGVEWNPQRLGQAQRTAQAARSHRGLHRSGGRSAPTVGPGPLAAKARRSRIWDAKTGEEEHVLTRAHGDVFSLVFSGDGQWLATAGEDTTIRIWDAKSWELRADAARSHRRCQHSGVQPRQPALGSGSRDRTMKIWNTTRWEETTARLEWLSQIISDSRRDAALRRYQRRAGAGAQPAERG
jgi:hypothetical protein